MGQKRYVGAAQTVAQVTTITVGGTAAINQVYTVLLGLNLAKTIAYTSSGVDTNTTIATALFGLLTAANTPPEFQEIAWANPSAGVITATSKTPGMPFGPATIATMATSTGTGTLVAATTTANGSPNDISNPANWDANAIPVGSDDVFLDGTGIDWLWGLDQHTVTLSSLTVSATFQQAANGTGNGTVGLPEWNPNGYPEYRPTYLRYGVTTFNLGRGQGAGSNRFKIDFGTVQTAANIYLTGSGQDLGISAVCLKGTHASNVVNVYGGQVQIAGFGDEVATVATLVVGPTNPASSDPQVRCGTGCTLTTITMESGSLLLASTTTTITQKGGQLVIQDGISSASAVTTLNAMGGQTDYQGSGTITNLNSLPSANGVGQVTFDSVNKGRTVTNCTITGGATVSDRFGSVTWTNGITFVGCTPAQATLRDKVTITVTYN
jgi:hypothetical protein